MTGLHDESRRIDLADEAATARFAARLAALARPGDVIALSGGLGAGKTVFARAFLRARGLDPALEVPSPTFTLVQVYDLPGGPVWHLDLYRLADPSEVWELGIEEALGEAILLVEWPERMGGFMPEGRLGIEIEPGAAAGARVAVLDAPGGWKERLAALPADG